MAINKVETPTPAEALVAELESSIENLPRTDHKTLPAVQIVKVDEESLARTKDIIAINHATRADEVVTEDGKTLQQVRNQFELGVTDLNEKASKHTFKVEGENVVIISPEIEGEEKSEQVIAPTLPNIAPVDAGQPTNPVEAEEAGMNVTPVLFPIVPTEPVETKVVSPTITTPTAKEAAKEAAPKDALKENGFNPSSKD